MRRSAWIAGAVVVCGLVVACGGGGVKAPAAKLVSRDEFRAKLLDKTPAEVTAAVGRPDTTSETGNYMGWEYYRRTFDPVTQTPDSWASLTFDRKVGKVIRVNFAGR